MKQFFLLSFLSLARLVVTQGVTDKVAPADPPPDGCEGDVDGKFVLTSKYVDDVADADENSSTSSGNSTAKFKKVKRDDTALLTCTIKGGQLFDVDGRTGYIASSHQFQFDAPPQNGSIYTAGFSICEDDKLALGNGTIWWACDSESYANIYDDKFASYCVGVYLYARKADNNTSSDNSTATATGNSTATGIVLEPTQSDEVYVSQIDNGQIEQPAKYPYTPTPSNPPPPPPTATAGGDGSGDGAGAGAGGDDGGDQGGEGDDSGEGDGGDGGGDDQSGDDQGGDDQGGDDEGGDDQGGDDKQPPDFAGTAAAFRIPFVGSILAGVIAALVWI